MIDFIKYTVDQKTYSLTNNGDGTWTRDEAAPQVAGNYLLTFTISENGIITTVDSSNSLYETCLRVVAETERVSYLEQLVPDFIAEMKEFAELYQIENENFDDLHAVIEGIKSDAFISTASETAVERIETLMGYKGIGTLAQRKSYLTSLFCRGNKFNEATIKGIADAITGSDCRIVFFGAGETTNPLQGYGYLRVQVLAPDTSKDYKYEDIARALAPLVPAHIKLDVMKYYALWKDIHSNYVSWTAVKAMSSWQAVKDYVAPE